jgi:thioredoxin family protein
MKWKYVFIGASLLLGACQPMGNKQADATKPSTETVSKDKKENSASKKVVEASFKTFDGKTVNLSDYKGKKVYIKVWASWCPTCLAGLPEVDSLAANHSDDTVVLSVVAPGVNREKKAEDFKEWFSGLDYKNLPVLMAETPDFFKQVGVIGYPTSVFINANGELVQAHPGHLSNEDIQKQLDKM